jgi:hypothetical protein
VNKKFWGIVLNDVYYIGLILVPILMGSSIITSALFICTGTKQTPFVSSICCAGGLSVVSVIGLYVRWTMQRAKKEG